MATVVHAMVFSADELEALADAVEYSESVARENDPHYAASMLTPLLQKLKAQQAAPVTHEMPTCIEPKGSV